MAVNFKKMLEWCDWILESPLLTEVRAHEFVVKIRELAGKPDQWNLLVLFDEINSYSEGELRALLRLADERYQGSMRSPGFDYFALWLRRLGHLNMPFTQEETNNPRDVRVPSSFSGPGPKALWQKVAELQFAVLSFQMLSAFMFNRTDDTHGLKAQLEGLSGDFHPLPVLLRSMELARLYDPATDTMYNIGK